MKYASQDNGERVAGVCPVQATANMRASLAAHKDSLAIVEGILAVLEGVRLDVRT